jgi:lipoate-protein ligase B
MYNKCLNILDLGQNRYLETWELQRNLHEKRVKGEIPDTLILVEHLHTLTLGKHTNSEHLLVSKDYLKSRGIEVFNTDRGGDITYHGPGQLVGYPIFNLKEHRESISWFVLQIEEVLIRVLLEFDIKAHREKGLTGIWVGDKKIAAIGMRVSRWVAMHGFALNISTDLSFFKTIIPCGIATKGVTRMIDINPDVEWERVKSATIDRFVEVFGYEIVNKNQDLLQMGPLVNANRHK